jgi:hypothetical protein
LEQDRERQSFPKTQAGLRRQDSYPVGAKRQKPALAERYFAGEAEQHVQPDADQCGGRQGPQQVGIVAGREQTNRNGAGDQHYGKHNDNDLHTRTLVRPPNNPDGASARAAMTAVKVTIWVLLEPSQVVAQASTKP